MEFSGRWQAVETAYELTRDSEFVLDIYINRVRRTFIVRSADNSKETDPNEMLLSSYKKGYPVIE